GCPVVVGTQQATGTWHPSQTLPVPELKPPSSVHTVASRVMCGPLSTVQSASVAQLAPVLLHFIVVELQVPVLVTVQHSTRPGLPHVERAEQEAMSATGQFSPRSLLRC